MSQHGRHSDRITDQAALWFVRAQDPELSAEERKELASWLAGSAEHVREYLSLVAVTQEIRSLTTTPSVDELIALAQDASDADNVVALLGPDLLAPQHDLPNRDSTDAPAAASGPAAAQRRTRLWATAAAALLLLTVSVAYFATSGPVTYKTGTGEQVSFPLPDGSVVTLNAQSSLQLAYTEGQRNVRLIGGEVFFDVAKDPERPFEVHTESAVARAVGTRFNVRFRDKDTTVTVVEGIVDVLRSGSAGGGRPRRAADPAVSIDSPGAGLPAVDKAAAQPQTVRLTVGQQAKVPPRAGQVAVTEIKTDKATSWRERRLVFDSWALSAVVEEFNLYNEQRIVVQDAGLAAQSISGVFSADDRASFVLFLAEADLAVAQTRADGTIVLRSPGGAR